MFVKTLAPRRADGLGSGFDPTADQSGIVVGLVNIMPPAAMRTAESMFRRLLEGFGASAKIHLRVFTLQNSTTEPCRTSAVYESLDKLWDSPDSAYPLDALIVTGTEARTDLMTDETCWPDLQRLCDWAAQNTISTIWSCFSAHAAVLHMDNIRRQPLPEKLTGVFECQKASSHPIFENMPARWAVPHSRYNNLNEAELAASGYEILSRSPSVGADTFIKQHGNSQFLFLQGHLEYGAEQLFSEYCRDSKRYSQGQRSTPPKLPENYLDQTSMTALATLQASIPSSPAASSQADFAKALAGHLNIDWQAPAQQLFTSWLSYIAEQKSPDLAEQPDASFPPAYASAFRDLGSSDIPEYIAPS
jgi:homoserine O-succinyltransferase